jgi:hypothetical protein
VQSRHVRPPNVGDARATNRGDDMLAQQNVIGLKGTRFPFCRDMQSEKVLGNFAKSRSLARGAPFGDRVRACLDGSQYGLGLGARFVWRQPAMLANVCAPGASILAILRN